jgi:hypothetical protein
MSLDTDRSPTREEVEVLDSFILSTQDVASAISDLD